MQYQHIGYGVKGFYRVGCYALKPTMNNEIIQHRLRVLEFWEKRGLQAATDHSGKSRRTLFNWKKQYHALGVSGLQAKSTAPEHRRKHQWAVELIQQIRYWRTELPNLGKEQLHVLLKPWRIQKGAHCLSEFTIGRLIGAAADNMRASPPALTPKGKPKRYHRPAVARRPKGCRPQRIGECVGLDAMERRVGSVRRYILACIDEVSDYALAMALPRLNSQAAKQFFEKCFRPTPFNVERIITDSGSGFKGAFDQLISDSQIVHLWTYPKTPEMNAVCERFNRAVQERFVDFHEDLLFTDLNLFNEKLADWLVKDNAIRPHEGLALKTPMQYIIDNHKKCNMGWSHTDPCRMIILHIESPLQNSH